MTSLPVGRVLEIGLNFSEGRGERGSMKALNRIEGRWSKLLGPGVEFDEDMVPDVVPDIISACGRLSSFVGGKDVSERPPGVTLGGIEGSGIAEESVALLFPEEVPLLCLAGSDEDDCPSGCARAGTSWESRIRVDEGCVWLLLLAEEAAAGVLGLVPDGTVGCEVEWAEVEVEVWVCPWA